MFVIYYNRLLLSFEICVISMTLHQSDHIKPGVPNLLASPSPQTSITSPHWYNCTQKTTTWLPLASPRLGTPALSSFHCTTYVATCSGSSDTYKIQIQKRLLKESLTMVDFEDGWLIKSSFITRDEMKLVQDRIPTKNPHLKFNSAIENKIICFHRMNFRRSFRSSDFNTRHILGGLKKK